MVVADRGIRGRTEPRCGFLLRALVATHEQGRERAASATAAAARAQVQPCTARTPVTSSQTLHAMSAR